MNRSSWWAYALHRPLGGRIISLGESTVLHLQNPQKATSWLWLTTNFRETRLAEVRRVKFAVLRFCEVRSSSQKVSKKVQKGRSPLTNSSPIHRPMLSCSVNYCSATTKEEHRCIGS